MSENVIIAIITACGGAAATAIVDSVRFNKKMQKGIMCSLGSDIRRDCEDAIAKGSIELIELRRINENNEVYHSLGGNGFVRTLIQKVNNLPIKDD